MDGQLKLLFPFLNWESKHLSLEINGGLTSIEPMSSGENLVDGHQHRELFTLHHSSAFSNSLNEGLTYKPFVGLINQPSLLDLL